MPLPGATLDWITLPVDIVVHIFSFLSIKDRNAAALVCHTWSEAFKHPKLWQQHTFWFSRPSHAMALTGVQHFGRYMKNITIGVNQMLKENRKNACALLEQFSLLGDRRLKSLKIEFSGENPLFYSGQEFLDSLRIFFSPVTDQTTVSLQNVDLSGLSVPFDDNLIDILSTNHRNLKSLNLLNKVLVCKVSDGCILRLVQQCRTLEELHVFHSSMSDEILLAFAEEDRCPLKYLSIMCRREEKYGHDLSDQCWLALSKKLPEFRVILAFDHTCPFNLIPVIMKSEIPIETLKLETFARCYDEVNTASSFYDKTLKHLIVHTRNSIALEEALLNIAKRCYLLKSLLVYCVVRKETIEEIFRLQPELKASGHYILNSEAKLDPWVMYSKENANNFQ